MRFKLDCILQDKIIPKDHNRLIVSFFKSALESYDKEIYNYFYSDPKEKDMTFSCYFQLEKFVTDSIILRDKEFSITISVENMLEAIHFYNAFIKVKGKEFKFGKDNKFKFIRLTKLKEKEIDKNIAVFKILSPVLIGEHNKETNKTWYHLLNDEKGLDVLKKNLIYTLSPRFTKEKVENIEIIPLDIKKTVVSCYGMSFSASRGMFAVRGDKEILNYMYKAGFGSKKSLGFGLLNCIE